jgi:hypothetical protein
MLEAEAGLIEHGLDVAHHLAGFEGDVAIAHHRIGAGVEGNCPVMNSVLPCWKPWL